MKKVMKEIRKNVWKVINLPETEDVVLSLIVMAAVLLVLGAISK